MQGIYAHLKLKIMMINLSNTTFVISGFALTVQKSIIKNMENWKKIL